MAPPETGGDANLPLLLTVVKADGYGKGDLVAGGRPGGGVGRRSRTYGRTVRVDAQASLAVGTDGLPAAGRMTF